MIVKGYLITPYADLSKAHLSGADLSYADLRGVDLSYADLSDAWLLRSNLACADLSGAQIEDTQFGSADLTGVDLTGAGIFMSRFDGADLAGANIFGAELAGNINLNLSDTIYNFYPSGDVEISGDAVLGETLSANTSTILDRDGLGSFVYEWLRNGEEVSGAIDASYKLTADDLGKSISVHVGYTDGKYKQESLTSQATSEVEHTNNEPTGNVVITGEAVLDGMLTADISGVKDADGIGTVSYKWLQNGTVNIAETGSTFNVSTFNVGVGEPVQIRSEISYTDNYGTEENLRSQPVGIVMAANNAVTGEVSLDGTARQGAKLTADASSLEDLDGLDGADDPEFDYQWVKTVNWTSTDILGATSSSYTLTANDVGSKVNVRVSYNDGFGSMEVVHSTATSAVENINDAPTGSPLLFGTAEAGETLTVDISLIADADGLGAMAYQWLRDGEAIFNATNSTYVLATEDVGTDIRAHVSYTDTQGTQESLNSNSIQSIQLGNRAPTLLPSIYGDITESATLTALIDEITDADGLGKFVYQWLRNGEVIEDATDSTYVLTSRDVDHRISVQVAYTDERGYEESLTSEETIRVTELKNDATGALILEGDFTVGNTIRVNTDAIRDLDTFDESQFAFTWMRGKEIIEGVESGSYTLTQDDIGSELTVWLVFTDGQGNLEALSASIDISSEGDPSVNTYKIDEVTNKLFLQKNILNLVNDKKYEHRDLLLKLNNKKEELNNVSIEFNNSIDLLNNVSEIRFVLEAKAQQNDNVNIDDSVLTSLINLLPNLKYHYYNVKIEDHTDPNSLVQSVDNNNFKMSLKRDFELAQKFNNNDNLINIDTSDYSKFSNKLIPSIKLYDINVALLYGKAIAICDATNNFVYGDDEQQDIRAGRGDDFLQGGGGNDTIEGGEDNDRLAGGEGYDTFIFHPNSDNDVVTDYKHNDDDLKFFNAKNSLLTSRDITETHNSDGHVVLTIASDLPDGFLPPHPSDIVSEALVDYYNTTTQKTFTVLTGGYQVPDTWTEGTPTDPDQYTPWQIEDNETMSVTLQGIESYFQNQILSVATRDGTKVNNVDLLTNKGEIASFIDNGLYKMKMAGTQNHLDGNFGFSNSGKTKAITSQDALDALRIAVGLDTSSGTKSAYDFISADMNQDGKITSADALEILKYSVGLTTNNLSKWVFLDSNTDKSNINKTNTDYTTGVTIADITSDTSVSLTAILIGDVNDSYSGLIA